MGAKQIAKVGTVAALSAVGAGAGYLGGLAWGGNTPGANYGTTSAVGAAAGAGAGLIAGGLAVNPGLVAGAALGLAEGAGAVGLGVAEGTGALAIGLGKGLTKIGAYGAQKYAGIGAGVGKGVNRFLLKDDLKNPNNLLGKKLSGLGATAVVGSALIGGAREAFNEFNTSHMGQRDGMITRATPRTPSYMDNAGATGDLVFAMNRNRRG